MVTAASGLQFLINLELGAAPALPSPAGLTLGKNGQLGCLPLVALIILFWALSACSLLSPLPELTPPPPPPKHGGWGGETKEDLWVPTRMPGTWLGSLHACSRWGLPIILRSWYYPHFTEEETEAQRDQETSIANKVEPGWEPLTLTPVFSPLPAITLCRNPRALVGGGAACPRDTESVLCPAPSCPHTAKGSAEFYTQGLALMKSPGT